MGTKAMNSFVIWHGSPLTATEITNSPNHDFEVWKNGGNGGKWRKLGGNVGRNSGHSTRCGLWRDVAEENGTKMGQTWETKHPFFTVPFPQFS